MKTYLGDSVYVNVEGGMVVLTTENGMGPNNEIYMESEVLEGFMAFLEETFDVVCRAKSEELK